MNFLSRLSALVIILGLFSTSLFAQQQNSKPKLNQLGFYPEGQKLAITPQSSATDFHIRDAETNIVVYEGTLSSPTGYSLSGETVRIADFTDFKTPGNYVLHVTGGSKSYEFEISNDPFDELSSGLVKALYFNRVSTSLSQTHAGAWARAAGHPDDNVIVHASAASTGRPAGSTISSPGGWYDAGDFNKYVVPISSSINHMLFAYEQFPEHFDNRDLNIPESGNAVPDVLDEALFALRWLFTMQDPEDGGVYNKLTHANFQGTVMPSQATASRYVVQKGTAATLDFAAVMAQAARIYEPMLPDFADSALAAAEAAWDWAQSNPGVEYDQNAMNSNYDPDIGTGGYGDSSFDDEFFWAGAELYITTNDDSYYPDGGWANLGTSGWGNVQALGVFSLIHHRKDLTAVGLADTSAVKSSLTTAFDWYIGSSQSSGYRSPFGLQSWQFNWGSNGGAGNLGMGIFMLYQVTGQQKYYDGALSILDYLLGRNAVGYSYVTGFGDQTPMNIHHRQSEADNVNDPVPGWVAGGANPNNQDQDCGSGSYNSTLPALSYADLYCSYSTNEITTYWNSPFIYLTAGIESVTPDFTGEISQPIQFTPLDDPDSLFAKGDGLTLNWTAEGVTEVDIFYRRFTSDNYTEIATNVDASTGTFTEFTIPNLPADSLLIKIQSSADADVYALSSPVYTKPARFVGIEDISTNDGDFLPNKRITFTWNSFEVDSIDILYKLTGDADFIHITRVDTDEENYRGFRVPDAPGDSVTFKYEDVSSDTIFAISDPIYIQMTVSNEPDDNIAGFKLHQNYPNPFNPSTSIEFNLTKPAMTSLKVYDTNGRLITTLVDGFKTSGSHTVRFDASNLASGLYLYRLETPDFTASRKMLLMK